MKAGKRIDRRWIWIALAVIMIVLRFILGFFPQFVESFYSRGLFQAIRYIGDYTISLSPLPLIYLLIAGLVYYLFKTIKNSSFRERTKFHNFLNFLLSTIAFASGLVFFFLLLWGLNYARVPIEQQLDLDLKPLSDEALKSSFSQATTNLNDAYLFYNRNSDFTDNLEGEVRKAVRHTFLTFDYPTPGRVRARQLLPKGILLRISTAGVYLPFVGECHIDAGLHSLQVPYVMAHEMAHGYGITDEGSCNFIALRSCLTSGNPYFGYSANLSYWKTLAYNYRSQYPEEYETIKATLEPGIIEDIREIRATMDQYPDIFPNFRDLAYNTYLKTQGIAEGMKNYSRVILLEAAYQNKVEEK